MLPLMASCAMLHRGAGLCGMGYNQNPEPKVEDAQNRACQPCGHSYPVSRPCRCCYWRNRDLPPPNFCIVQKSCPYHEVALGKLRICVKPQLSPSPQVKEEVDPHLTSTIPTAAVASPPNSKVTISHFTPIQTPSNCKRRLAINFRAFQFSGSVKVANDYHTVLPLHFTCSPAPNRANLAHAGQRDHCHSLRTTLFPREEMLSSGRAGAPSSLASPWRLLFSSHPPAPKG